VALSRQQAEIRQLPADALTTTEIGERLDVSPRTVEAHLRAVYRKLGVRSRTAAARGARDHGLIDQPSQVDPGDSRAVCRSGTAGGSGMPRLVDCRFVSSD
jgi:DNA-binding CsgD family transcriptional regulator